MKITDQARRAYREYIGKMHGTAPNRLLLTEEDNQRFQAEVEVLAPLMNKNYAGPVQTTVWMGMRIVVDPNANGVEVAYAR